VLVLLLAVAIADESVPSPPPHPMRDPVVRPPCHSINDCWLDVDGTPIKRPKNQRGKPLPSGNCGLRINWLRNRLGCEEGRCVANFVGDRC
jgi:hypothetical protein